MRHKYAIWRLYPVYNLDGIVKYTSGYHLYFYTKFGARLNKFIIDAWDNLIRNENRKYYYARLSYVPKYWIEQDLDIDYADNGRWRSYQLYANGDSLAELIKEATISEIDQDGGEIRSYSLHDCSSEVFNAAIIIIENKVING